MEDKKYNFLVFLVDQMSYRSMGHSGNKDVKTHNLDRIAREGVSFSHGYCQNSVCMPSRATLATGLTPTQHGCITNGCFLDESIPTLAQVLSNHGYKTGNCGKIHLQPNGVMVEGKQTFSWENKVCWNDGEIEDIKTPYYGFQEVYLANNHVVVESGHYHRWLEKNHPELIDRYKMENAIEVSKNIGSCWKYDVPPEEHYNNKIADESIDFIKRHKNDNFYLHCSFPDPHHPFAATKPYCDMYDPKKITISETWNRDDYGTPSLNQKRNTIGERLSEDGIRDVTSQTYGMITHVDDCIGKVLDALDEEGLSDNTIVVFLSDHGEYLGSHNLVGKDVFRYEELINVPNIWRIPGVEARGVDEDNYVSHIDFVPTILDFAGISQTEMFVNRRVAKSSPKKLPGLSLKNLLLENRKIDRDDIFVEYDDDWYPDGLFRTRTIIERPFKLTTYGVNREGTLFNLEEDPNELKNLFYEDEYSDIVKDLTLKLYDFVVDTSRLVDCKRVSGA